MKKLTLILVLVCYLVSTSCKKETATPASPGGGTGTPTPPNNSKIITFKLMWSPQIYSNDKNYKFTFAIEDTNFVSIIHSWSTNKKQQEFDTTFFLSLKENNAHIMHISMPGTQDHSSTAKVQLNGKTVMVQDELGGITKSFMFKPKDY